MKTNKNRKKAQRIYAVLVCCFASCTSVAKAQPPEPGLTPPKPPERISMEDLSRSIGGPTLVTLQFQEASAQEVFHSLSQQAAQAGLKIDVDNEFLLAEHKKPVTIDIVNRPIWEAMREIAPRLGLEVQGWKQSPREITLARDGTPLEGPAVNAFPCVILLDALRGTRTLYPDTRPPQTNLNVLFQVLVEPKLYTLPASFQFNLTEARDETGQSLLPDAGTMVSNRHRGGRLSLGIQVENLVLPAQTGRRLTNLRGTLRFLVRTKSELWEVPDILQVRNATKTVVTPYAKERYEVIEAFEEDERYSVIRVKVTREVIANPFNNAEQFFESPVPFDDDVAALMRVIDAQGKELQYSGGHYSTDIDEMAIDFQVTRIAEDPRGKPATLILEIPLEYKEVIIPFEFKDLPLP